MGLLGSSIRLVLFAALFFTAQGAFFVSAQDNNFTPGIYGGGLLAAFEPKTKTVNGYYAAQSADGKSICAFYFAGTLEKDKAAIRSFLPMATQSPIDGVLTVLGNDRLSISLDQEYPGCSNVRSFADRAMPVNFELAAARPAWQAMRIVRSEKGYFFAAKDSKLGRNYLTRGDVVAVVKPGENFVKVEFIHGEYSTFGSIRTSDLY